MPSRALATNDPIELLEQAEVLRRRAEQSFGEYALEAGRLLIAAKRRLPHGSWADHIKQHTGFSLRTAEVYMRARRRYDALPAGERASVLEQPFTRSFLVLAQAPKALPGESEDQDAERPKAEKRTLPPRGVNGATTPAVDSFLAEQQPSGIDALIDASSTYHPDIQAQDFVPEPTPFDNAEAEMAEISEQAIKAEMQEQFDAALAEVEKLERENRDLKAQIAQAQKSSPAQMRGWDFVQSLYQYLRADEPARTPESLARRAAAIAGGRETVAYLEQFFAATRNHLRLAEGEPLPV